MMGILGDLLLREVPMALLAGVNSGELHVYGSIIRSVTTGRIVGHLQEAGGLSQLASVVGSVSSPLTAGLSLAADGVQIVQNEQIKAGIHMLQQLGVANLALSAAGIGVSVAGFAILSRKIDGVKLEVASVGRKIDALSTRVEALQWELIAAELDRLRGLAIAMDEAWTLSAMAAERRWHDVAQDALILSAQFEGRASRLLADGVSGLLAAEPMLDGLDLANTLRVSALAASGEMSAAFGAANDGAQSIERLTGSIGLCDLSFSSLANEPANPGTLEWLEALERSASLAQIEVERLRNREAAAATRDAPLRVLEREGVHARDWLATVRETKDVPVVLMMQR